jgi:hypothetical protein
MKRLILSAFFGVLTMFGTPQKAHAYDVDCAIILCMAGEFPPSAVCAHAYSTMIRRITPWPVRPPFGICTFAAVPIALGGPGGEASVDTSLPEYEWLDQTRVVWWRLDREGEREGGVWFNWTIRSCNRENTHCTLIESVRYSDNLPSGAFVTENGLTIARPSSQRRGIVIEFGDYNGNVGRSDWIFY